MVYDTQRPTIACTVCGSNANGASQEFNVWQIVDCARCGDFEVSFRTAAAHPEFFPIKDLKLMALASHLIRKLQAPGTRPALDSDFFASLRTRALPRPAEASDNLLIWVAEQQDDRPGKPVQIKRDDLSLLAICGLVAPEDIDWHANNLVASGDLHRSAQTMTDHIGHLTAKGWTRFENLKLAHVSSHTPSSLASSITRTWTRSSVSAYSRQSAKLVMNSGP